jgi:hypothetical protein
VIRKDPTVRDDLRRLFEKLGPVEGVPVSLRDWHTLIVELSEENARLEAAVKEAKMQAQSWKQAALARQITAEQYRTQTGGDFDEVWSILPDGERVEVLDVEPNLRMGMVIVDTPRGIMPLMTDSLLNVR